MCCSDTTSWLVHMACNSCFRLDSDSACSDIELARVWCGWRIKNPNLHRYPRAIYRIRVCHPCSSLDTASTWPLMTLNLWPVVLNNFELETASESYSYCKQGLWISIIIHSPPDNDVKLWHLDSSRSQWKMQTTTRSDFFVRYPPWTWLVSQIRSLSTGRHLVG